MPFIDRQLFAGNGSYRTITDAREEGLNMLLIAEQCLRCTLFFDPEIFEKIREER